MLQLILCLTCCFLSWKFHPLRSLLTSQNRCRRWRGDLAGSLRCLILIFCGLCSIEFPGTWAYQWVCSNVRHKFDVLNYAKNYENWLPENQQLMCSWLSSADAIVCFIFIYVYVYEVVCTRMSAYDGAFCCGNGISRLENVLNNDEV